MATRKKAAAAKQAQGSAARSPTPLSCQHDGTWTRIEFTDMRFVCDPDKGGCGALGYRRLGAQRGVRLYRCKTKGCNAPAVKRGWHGLVEVFWCAAHVGGT